MASRLQKAGVFTCSIFLCLGISSIASSSDKMGDTETEVIKGEILRIEGANYFVKSRESGKEVRLHIDKNTHLNALGVNTGDKVVVKMDDQHHVLSILPDQTPSK